MARKLIAGSPNAVKKNVSFQTTSFFAGACEMTRVIDLSTEAVFSLSQAGKILHKSHPSVYRYAVDGVRGIKLETVLLGKARLTSLGAIQRFLDRLADAE